MPSRSMLRNAFVVVATLIATAAIGFGGLASWSVTTRNNGNTFASGTVHHTNVARVGGAGAPVNCTDLAGVCGVIFTVSNARPGTSGLGTVQITSTGSLNSIFTLTRQSAVVSGAGATLCTSLQVTIVDAEAPPATVYAGALTTMPALAVRQSGGNGTWASGDTNTFTITVTLPAASVTTDQGSTCTVAYTWSQTNT